MRKVAHTSEFSFGVHWWILKKWKNQILEKMKKIAGDIIILHMCTKNENHMRYSSCDTKWDIIFWHFGPFFAFLTASTLTTQKNKILKKWKKHLEMSSFQTCATKKHDHMMYAYSDMKCLQRHNFLSFQATFCFFAQLLTPAIKIWKKM